LQVSIWKQALTLLEGSQNTLLLAIAHYRLGVSAIHAGLGGIAESSLDQANRLLRASPKDEATMNNELEAEVWLARLAVSKRDFMGAFDRLNRARADVNRSSSRYVAMDFYEALGELEARQGALEKAEEDLSTAIAFAEQGLASLHTEADRLLWNRGASGAYRALVELKMSSGDTNGALRLWEWYRAAGVRWRNKGPERTRDTSEPSTSPRVVEPLAGGQTFADVSLRLKNTTVLTYGLLPSGLAIWISDESGVTGKWFPNEEKTLLALAHAFVDLCADPNSNPIALQGAARSLYQKLVAPVSDHLRAGTTLVFESDGELAYVPMQALIGPDGTFLGQTFPLVWSPGSYIYGVLRRSSAVSRSARALVVASPAMRGGVEDPGAPGDTREEVGVITTLLPNYKLLKGRQATLRQVESDLPWATVFHFAGHASATAVRVGLHLSSNFSGDQSDEGLNVLNLRPERLAAVQLAVLSGCSTGRGAEDGPYDAESLTYAFLRAGVPHVVASRWDVDSAVTGTLMGKFYSGLLSGQSVAQSLQKASEYIRSQDGYAHPYFWAAFSAFGKT
jgi:CHAT domain-containing protein